MDDLPKGDDDMTLMVLIMMMTWRTSQNLQSRWTIHDYFCRHSEGPEKKTHCAFKKHLSCLEIVKNWIFFIISCVQCAKYSDYLILPFLYDLLPARLVLALSSYHLDKKIQHHRHYHHHHHLCHRHHYQHLCSRISCSFCLCRHSSHQLLRHPNVFYLREAPS